MPLGVPQTTPASSLPSQKYNNTSCEKMVSIGHSANCRSVPWQENSCSHIDTLPIPKADFSGAPVAGGKPNIRHTTVAAALLHPNPHKLCHCPSANTSARPWLGDTPSDNLTGTKNIEQKLNKKNATLLSHIFIIRRRTGYHI